MKKITKITAALLVAVIPLVSFGCKHSNNDIENDGKSEPVVIPEDAMRNWTSGSKVKAWSVYGVEDLEKLSEAVNAGNDFAGKTITVKNDIVINENVLTKDFEEPAEGAEPGTPNPKFKNLDSIGRGVSPEEDYEACSFSGTFDGNGKVISGLYMYQGHQGLGFFGVVDGATIKNVILVDACVINRNLIPNPDTSSSYPHDNKDDDRFGGLVGVVDGNGAGVTIENCLFAGVVGSQTALDRGSPYEYIGGLIGRADTDATVKDSFVFARIYGSREDKTDVVCGKKPTNVDRTNINGEDDKGVEIKDFGEDVAKEIADAVKAVQANVK